MIESTYPRKTSINLSLSLTNLNSITYTPSVFEAAKMIWIVYFSLLVPIWFIGRGFLQYVYSNQLFKTRTILRIGDIVLHENKLT